MISKGYAKTGVKKNIINLKDHSQGFSQRVVKGGFWVFLLKITQHVFNLLKLTILARILAPHDFGLMGIALLTMATLETFSRTGFLVALVQKKRDIKAYLDSAWTVLVLRGFILFTILYFTAPYAAIFFEAPEAKLIIQVIGLAILLQAFTNIGIIYFQKELEFDKQFVYLLSGTIADFVVAVSAALILRSVWALVFGSLAVAIVRLIVSYLIHPYRPRLSFDLYQAKELFSFGKWILGSSILVFLVFQGDDIFVGKLLGVTLLSFYQMAYRFSNAPATEIAHVISNVTFPAYSKLQDNLPSLRQAFLKTLKLTAFISIPLAGGIFILAPEFTNMFLGEKWMPMVPILQILVFAGLLNSIGATAGTIFQSVGKPQIDTKWQLIRLFVLATSIYPLSIQWGIMGTSISVLLALIVSTAGKSFMVVKITQCGMREYGKVLVFPLISGIIMASFISTLKICITTVEIWQFFLFAGIGILIHFGVTYLLDKFFNYGICLLIKESLILLKGS